MINRPDICGDQMVPRAIPRETDEAAEDNPDIPFGLAYHGQLDHRAAERLLEGKDEGCFLIRRSASTMEHFTLTVRFQGRTRHYKLYYERASGQFYLKQQYKHFHTIEELVEDGLINYHLEQIHGKDPDSSSMRAISNQNLLIKPKDGSQKRLNVERRSTEDLLKQEHVLKEHTFRGLNMCTVCAQFLWGFSVQGFKCENCSFVAHKRCAETNTKVDCLMDRNESKGLFGVELTELTKSQPNVLPFLVVKCVEEIEARGIYVEGIYRVSGFADEVEELRGTFEKLGRQTNVSADNINIHVVAGVLKLFFRSLSTPLITAECAAQLMDHLEMEDQGKRLKLMKTNLLRLPSSHWSCVKYISNHLRRVATYHDQNKMNETNLATVLAPTLIGTNLNIFTDLSREIILLSFIIRNCTILF